MEKLTMEKIVNYAKQYGFIFQGSEIYGGLANSWDYGPLGREIKENIKKYGFGVDVGGTTIKMGLFDAEGNVLDKWEIVTRTENNGENVLPDINVGDILKQKELKADKKTTEPPARYTEASLVKAMEENGVGRPSTYAPTISTIEDRLYIEKEGKYLVPTDLGMVVNKLLEDNFKDIVDVKFTADMEHKLDEVAENKIDYVQMLKDFYGPFITNLNEVQDKIEKVKVPEQESDVVCEKCGRNMIVKSSRFGKFLACPGYPQCKNTKPAPEDEVKQPCPKCGSKLIKRLSKKTGKKFYGCTNYPDCDFAAPGVPTGDKCPECGGFIISGFKGRKFCMNGDCPTRTAPAKKSTKKSAKK